MRALQDFGFLSLCFRYSPSTSCFCHPLTTEPEAHKGETVFEGDVEIFQLEGHPQAKVAYGWGWEDNAGEIEYIGVLQINPVESAATAVKDC